MAKKHPKPFPRTDRGKFRGWYIQIGRHQRKLADTEDGAWKAYHELMARPPEARALAAGAAVPAVAVLNAFLDWARANRAPRTYEWYRDFIEVFADSIPPTIAASDLAPYHATRVMDSRPGWSANTKYAFARAVSRAFNWAARQKLIPSSPMAGLEKPTPEARESYASPADYEEAVALASPPAFRDVIRFAWETGARPQEIRVIEARHVRAGEGRVVIPRTEAKGKRSARVIYLTDEAAEIVRPLCERHPSGPVFRNGDGNPWTRHSINCAFRRLSRRAGRPLHLGAFRKGWATEALKNGVDVLTAAHLMGHANSNMLARHYAKMQADPKFMADAARRARGRK